MNMSVREYAASLETILQSNDIDMEGETPLSLMQAVIETSDEQARQKLSALGNAQAVTAQELLMTPVSPALADEHLLVIRSIDSLAKTAQLVANYEKDPLGAMSALMAYTPASRDFVNALRSIATAILAEGEPAAGAPGAYVVELVRAAESL